MPDRLSRAPYDGFRISGPPDQLDALMQRISAALPADWTRRGDLEARLARPNETWFCFACDAAADRIHAFVSLHASGADSIVLANITPLVAISDGRLTQLEYDRILDEFLECLVSPHANELGVTIDRDFGPLRVQ